MIAITASADGDGHWGSAWQIVHPHHPLRKQKALTGIPTGLRLQHKYHRPLVQAKQTNSSAYASSICRGGGGRRNEPYASSLPLSSQFQGGGGGWVWGSGPAEGEGGTQTPPNIYGLKMTP